MGSRNTTHTRIYAEDREKLKELSAEITGIQKHKVDIPEVLRRTLNIPNLKIALMTDAEAKKRLKGR